MAGMFRDYELVLLDAAFFEREFSEELRHGLEEVPVWVSDTFHSELKQYRILLSPEKRQNYDKNIQFIGHKIQTRGLHTEAIEARDSTLHNDAWGMINILTGAGKQFCLLTANQTLIQRVVMEHKQLDIFDLSENRLITYNDFGRWERKYELKTDDLWCNPDYGERRAQEGTVLYRQGKRSVLLGAMFAEGKEAQLFRVAGDGGLMVKVFKQGKLDAGKQGNILRLQGINDKMGIGWALFPQDVVYYDSLCTDVAGFVEEFCQAGEDLSNIPLYAGDIEAPDIGLGRHLSYTLDICLKAVRQVCFLNIYGVITSDFNMANFAYRSRSDYLQMWDTDSFGYETFFGEFFSGDRTAREYDLTTKAGAIGFCEESLYVFIFRLLSLGDAPINENTGRFKYANPKYGFRYRKELFPPELWSLMDGVFRCEKLPSPTALMQRLEAALELCRRNPAANKTYAQLLEGILPPELLENVQPCDEDDAPEELSGESADSAAAARFPWWLAVLLAMVGALLVVYIIMPK